MINYNGQRDTSSILNTMQKQLQLMNEFRDSSDSQIIRAGLKILSLCIFGINPSNVGARQNRDIEHH